MLSALARGVNSVLRPFDVKITKLSALPECSDDHIALPPAPLPSGAATFLQTTNAQLLELRERYAALNNHPTRFASLWSEDFVSEISLAKFRAHNAYLWQGSRTAADQLAWLLTGYYVKQIDRLGLLDRLEEDGLFGAYCFRFMDRYVGSKDLLDSVNEINFLERCLHISAAPSLTVLDIGAGYGRLLHRLATTFPDSVTGFCADAVPESTFLSQYYLDFRGLGGRVSVLPLDTIERDTADLSVDLVTNVHSFSECSLRAIEWWLDLATRLNAKHLFIVPNAYHNGGTKLLSREPDGTFLDFQTAIESRGFRLCKRDPKYLDPNLHAFGINTYHYLFTRT